MNEEKVERLRRSLQEAETAWLVAENAIIAALQSAEKSYETCMDVRHYWTPDEGPALCDLSYLAIEHALYVRSRARSAAKITKEKKWDLASFEELAKCGVEK